MGIFDDDEEVQKLLSSEPVKTTSEAIKKGEFFKDEIKSTPVNPYSVDDKVFGGGS